MIDGVVSTIWMRLASSCAVGTVVTARGGATGGINSGGGGGIAGDPLDGCREASSALTLVVKIINPATNRANAPPGLRPPLGIKITPKPCGLALQCETHRDALQSSRAK